MSNLSARLQNRKLPSKDVPICLDLGLIGERDRATAAVVAASKRSDDRMVSGPDVKGARAALEAVEARIREQSFVLRITGVDRIRYNQFLNACPPRKGRAEAFDSSKFFMHVAKNTAQYVDESGAVHPITDDEWKTIDETLTDGEHDRIAAAVIEVNREVGSSDLGFLGSGSATTRDSFGTSA